MAAAALTELIEQADALSREDQLRLARHLIQRVLQTIQTTMDQVHEPDAGLANADDALQDAARLRAVLHQSERSVQLRVPLSALLEALDALDPKELRQVAQHAQDRLATTGQR